MQFKLLFLLTVCAGASIFSAAEPPVNSTRNGTTLTNDTAKANGTVVSDGSGFFNGIKIANNTSPIPGTLMINGTLRFTGAYVVNLKNGKHRLVKLSGYDYHNKAVCVSSTAGGDAVSGVKNPNRWEGLTDTKATECACNAYRIRRAGLLQNDMCPDCRYDVATETCYSEHWHIGSVEFKGLCQYDCGAKDWEGRG
ncbi:hypothetical protein GGTG_12666 [Gaeumannomyces tritici R3-111a-1]|uniref:Uncharacterized protein n=1 Tax=Gaeumannomyces tritici (strain R3-111a-1) TaxID=644352 RepID=J3PGN7_GAET3|nr:hypothetical protein GGTG_12666 [Gaeumannomyces tritici R3-111a-1]EJT69783.1 hypothetical protein GGTG_12666 [Gaeumannomyces tritici R3-111a-1]